jgi:iron complex outermembrane receptor protein
MSGKLSSFFSWILVFVVILVSNVFAGGASSEQENLLEKETASENIGTSGEDFFEMSIEDLLNVEVTSSARRPQPIKLASSAVYVITAEDIRMSGATRLTDLFRLVPGMQVNDRRSFASNVGIRGFAMHNSRMYQVLLDGRSMYDAYKGGTEEDWQPLFLENIERIEIIRGPGGVAWGANAMNGVINIITKKPADTQGGFVGGTFGTHALQDGIFRYGGSDEDLAWRVSTGAYHSNGFGIKSGNAWNDYLQAFQGTGRTDIQLDDTSSMTISGGHKYSTYEGTTKVSIQYMHIAWDKILSKNSSVRFLYGRNYFRNYPDSYYSVTSREEIFELQHSFVYGPHHFVTGMDWTRDYYKTKPDGVTYLSINDPNSYANDQGSTFIEDEITLRDDLWLTLGYRSYHNELTGRDWAGRSALVWEAMPNHFFRASVSRAFSRPTLQGYFILENRGTLALEADPNDRQDNEHLVAYEVGYRGQIRNNLDVSVDAFYNQHKDLIGQDPTGSHLYVHNVLDIDSYGVETAINYKPVKWWLIRATHSYEHQTERDTMNESPNRLMIDVLPKHKVTLMNRFYIDESTTLNTQLFFVDTYYDHNRASTGSMNRQKIPPYFRLDARLSKQLDKNTEVAFGAMNLTDPYHLERDLSNIPRVFYAQLFCKF